MSGKGKWLCAGTAWATREIGMTQPSITIALGAERNNRMITITYHKSLKPIPEYNEWEASKIAHLDANTKLWTFMYVEGDTPNRFDNVWFESISNPLTRLRNHGRVK